MFLMRKHENPQNLVLIGVQKNEKKKKKKTIDAFYQTLSVHSMNN